MSSNSRTFFSKEEKEKILKAILEAELNTSGEIRLHIENECEEDVLDRAAFVFKKLKMDKTAQRNGVLFYLAIESKKFAILGDKGINAVVPSDFWNEIKEQVLLDFSHGEFALGLSKGIASAGLSLKKHFPHKSDDVNELSDDISFG
jgi:uncharacterized membrane protein